MFRKNPKNNLLLSQKGFGLITAIFVITILATFGVLVARYTMTSAVSSSEDYVWAQALYSADSVAQLRILNHDNGGNWGGGWVKPAIAGLSTTINTDTFPGFGAPATLRVRANSGPVSREIEVKYIL